MAWIFTSAALGRLLAHRDDDPLVRWFDQQRMLPVITPVALADLRRAVRHERSYNDSERLGMVLALAALAHDLDADTYQHAVRRYPDSEAVDILSQLLDVPAGEAIGEIDMISAALAIRHEMHLVVTDKIEHWNALARNLPNATWTLRLVSEFPPQ